MCELREGEAPERRCTQFCFLSLSQHPYVFANILNFGIIISIPGYQEQLHPTRPLPAVTPVKSFLVLFCGELCVLAPKLWEEAVLGPRALGPLPGRQVKLPLRLQLGKGTAGTIIIYYLYFIRAQKALPQWSKGCYYYWATLCPSFTWGYWFPVALFSV